MELYGICTSFYTFDTPNTTTTTITTTSNSNTAPIPITNGTTTTTTASNTAPIPTTNGTTTTTTANNTAPIPTITVNGTTSIQLPIITSPIHSSSTTSPTRSRAHTPTSHVSRIEIHPFLGSRCTRIVFASDGTLLYAAGDRTDGIRQWSIPTRDTRRTLLTAAEQAHAERESRTQHEAEATRERLWREEEARAEEEDRIRRQRYNDDPSSSETDEETYERQTQNMKREMRDGKHQRSPQQRSPRTRSPRHIHDEKEKSEEEHKSNEISPVITRVMTKKPSMKRMQTARLKTARVRRKERGNHTERKRESKITIQSQHQQQSSSSQSSSSQHESKSNGIHDKKEINIEPITSSTPATPLSRSSTSTPTPHTTRDKERKRQSQAYPIPTGVIVRLPCMNDLTSMCQNWFALSRDDTLLVGIRSHDISPTGERVPCRRLIIIDRFRERIITSDTILTSSCVALSLAPDEQKRCLVGLHSGELMFFDTSNAKIVNTYFKRADPSSEPHPIMDTSFSPDGRHLILTRQHPQKPLTIWSTRTQQLLGSLEGHMGYAKAVWTSDGDSVISMGMHGDDVTIRIWPHVHRSIFPKGRILANLRTPYTRFRPPHAHFHHALTLSPTRQLIACAHGITLYFLDYNGKILSTVTCWELLSRDEMDEDEKVAAQTPATAFLPATITSTTSTSTTSTSQSTPSPLFAAVTSPRSTMPNITSKPSSFLSLPSPTSRPPSSHGHTSIRALSRQGSRPASRASKKEETTTTSTSTTNPAVIPLTHTTYITTLTFSPDGTMLAYGTSTGGCGIWTLSRALQRGEEDTVCTDSILVPHRRATQRAARARAEEQKQHENAVNAARQAANAARDEERRHMEEARKARRAARRARRKAREDERRRKLYGGTLPEVMPQPLPAKAVIIDPFNRTKYVATLLAKVESQGQFAERLDNDIEQRRRRMEEIARLKAEAAAAAIAAADGLSPKGPPSFIKQKQSEFLERLNRDMAKRRRFRDNRERYYEQ